MLNTILAIHFRTFHNMSDFITWLSIKSRELIKGWSSYCRCCIQLSFRSFRQAHFSNWNCIHQEFVVIVSKQLYIVFLSFLIYIYIVLMKKFLSLIATFLAYISLIRLYSSSAFERCDIASCSPACAFFNFAFCDTSLSCTMTIFHKS